MASHGTRASDDFHYPSASSFNFRELGVILLFGAFLLLILLIPFLLNFITASGGLNLDTYKEIGDDSALLELLPDVSTALSTEYNERGMTAVYPGQRSAAITEFENRQSAVAAWEGRSGGASSAGSGQWLRRGERNGQRFVEWVNGRRLFELWAPDRDGLEELIRQSPLIDLPGEPGYGAGKRPFFARLIMDYPLVFALGLDALILLFLGGGLAGGLAIATRRPKKGAPRISRDGLRSQLLALNSDDCEFVIEEVAPYHLVGRWKYEVPHYRSLFGNHGMREAYQLDLYLNPDGPVGALETRGSVAWDMQATPPRARINWKYFRGIVLFEVSTRKVWTVDPQNLRFEKAVDFNFDVRRFREPLVQLITAGGWRFRPLLFRPLVWRG